MTPAPSSVVRSVVVPGGGQHDGADDGIGAAQRPPAKCALPAHSLHGVPPQLEETSAMEVDLSKPILSQVLLVYFGQVMHMAPAGCVKCS